jgi:hypothetical protein
MSLLSSDIGSNKRPYEVLGVEVDGPPVEPTFGHDAAMCVAFSIRSTKVIDCAILFLNKSVCHLVTLFPTLDGCVRHCIQNSMISYNKFLGFKENSLVRIV